MTTTRTAYVLAQFTSGVFQSFKVDLSDPSNENKIRNLKAGSVTTFDIPEDDKDYVSFKQSPNDKHISQTRTIFPTNLAQLTVKVVESTIET